MALIVAIVGVAIVLIGAAVFVVPGSLKRMTWALVETGWFNTVAILRVIIGVLFLLAASDTRSPLFVTILGVFFILAGILIPILGATRIKAIAGWWLERNDMVIRLWGLVAIALGIAIAWTGL